MLAFDHLVVAAQTLQQGIAYVEGKLGVALSPGGQHVFMGTHNALLRLGKDSYLEVIAIDPTLPSPQRPRWFNLDDTDLQQQLAVSPRLIHWVARTSNIEEAKAKAPLAIGEVVAASRGALNWKITIPKNGALPLNGAFPTLIEWPEGEHVAIKMPDQACSLISLQINHPDAMAIEPFLTPEMAFIELIPTEKPHLAAVIKTPKGEMILE